MFNLDAFIQEHCIWCGTQRCDPSNLEWLEGCRKYREEKSKENQLMEKYRIYNDGKKKTIAVSTYAGKTVRGVAKCDPRDEFVFSKGEDLAIARCAEKVASWRLARAKKEFEKAKNMVAIAQKRLAKMDSYVKDSVIAYNTAKKNRENFENSF